MPRTCGHITYRSSCDECMNDMNKSPVTLQPFPPHWFTMYRIGTVIGFRLVPCTVSLEANQWCIYADSLRVSDLIEAVDMMKSQNGQTVVLAYVDSIDSADYLMEAARATLLAWDEPARQKAFGDRPVEPAPPGSGVASQPAEPLPPGHPDSFSMDALRAELNQTGDKPPVPFGSHYTHDADRVQ